MKASWRWVAALPVALLFLGAASRPAAKPGKAPPSVVTASFDMTSVPLELRQDNFAAIFKALSVSPKGEFETTEQFKERLAARSRNVVFFVHPGFTYDADHEVWGASVMVEKPGGLGSYEFHEAVSIVTGAAGKKTGRHTGVTAMGVRFPVETRVAVVQGLIIDEKLAGWSYLSSPSVQLRIPATTANAKALKNRIGLLLIAHLAPRTDVAGLRWHSTAEDGASLDSPIDVFTDYSYLFADRLRFLAFDVRSGEILDRVDLGSAPSPSSLEVQGPQRHPAGQIVGSIADEAVRRAWLACRLAVAARIGSEKGVEFDDFEPKALVARAGEWFSFSSTAAVQGPLPLVRSWTCDIEYQGGAASEPTIELKP